MKYAELVERYAGRRGATKKAAGEEIEAVVSEVAEALAESGEVTVRGLGTLKLVRSPARELRSGITGRTTLVPGSFRIALKSCASLRRRING